MNSRSLQVRLLLTWWTILLCLAWPGSAEANHGSRKRNCQTAAYPAAKLLPATCQPVPAWCRRQAGHGARSWRRCRARCDAGRLQLGEVAYPIAWLGGAKNKQKKQQQQQQKKSMTLFSLALHGWHRRRLTIWHGRLYARKRGDRAWSIVYQVGERLVALPLGSKPPKNCGGSHGKATKKTAQLTDGSHGGGDGQRLRGVHASCHGNACSLRLSLRRLLQQVHKLGRHNRRDRRRHRKVALHFVLAASGQAGGSGKRVRLVSAKIALIGRGDRKDRRRGRRQEAENPAAEYQRFLDKRRERYWQRRGRKGGAAAAAGGAKNAGRNLKHGGKRAHGRGRANRRQSKQQEGDKAATQSEGPLGKDRLKTMFNILDA